jgi:hypothetical protein
MVGICEQVNEPLVSIKCKFLELLSILSASQEGFCSIKLVS